MVKPDGVERGLVGEIIKRFEAKGYQLTALELMHPTKEHLEEHVCIKQLELYTGFYHSANIGSDIVLRPQGEEVLPWSYSIHVVWPCCRYGLDW
jgi:nucleoside diphosphate kinase